MGLWNTLTSSPQRSKTTATTFLDMTLSQLIAWLQLCCVGQYRVPVHRHRSQVHSDPEW